MKHIISLGAGVQSSTMALMAAAGKITPMPEAAVFADTQSEPRSVYEWLDWLEPQLPFPVYRVTKGNLRADTLRVHVSKKDGRRWAKTLVPAFTLNPDGTKGKLPFRACTMDYKIGPIVKKVKALVGAKRAEKRLLVTQWIGISIDEAHRMKDSRVPWSVHRYPLIDLGMSREDCLQWMKDQNHPVPPRSACTFCPYHSDTEWNRLKFQEPEAFADAVAFEWEFQRTKEGTDNFKSIPFLHASRKPLDTVDFGTDPELDRDLWGEECEGMCGI